MALSREQLGDEPVLSGVQGRGVRADQNPGIGPQRAVGRQWFGREDVERGESDVLVPQCIDQCRFVDDRARPTLTRVKPGLAARRTFASTKPSVAAVPAG